MKKLFVLFAFVATFAAISAAQNKLRPKTAIRTQNRQSRKIVYDRVHSLPAGRSWSIPLTVNETGYQFGGFAVRDDSADLNDVILNSLSKGTYRRPPADIEILIMEEAIFADYSRGRAFSAVYSSGRKQSGIFNVRLVPGQYRIVISNRHSLLTPKSVVLTLYEFSRTSS